MTDELLNKEKRSTEDKLLILIEKFNSMSIKKNEYYLIRLKKLIESPQYSEHPEVTQLSCELHCYLCNIFLQKFNDISDYLRMERATYE